MRYYETVNGDLSDFGNLVPRASVAFPQKASRPADTPGKRPLMLARSHRAGSVQELTV